MNKILDEAFDIIESVALNHHQWANERGHPMKTLGKYDMNALDLILAKMDALTQRFNQFNISVVNVTNVSSEICGAIDHTTMKYQIGVAPSQEVKMEQANVINNFNQRSQNNSYSSIFNLGRKNYPNFSYRNTRAKLDQVIMGCHRDSNRYKSLTWRLYLLIFFTAQI